MKIERLEFVCINAMKEQKDVTIYVKELKVVMNIESIEI